MTCLRLIEPATVPRHEWRGAASRSRSIGIAAVALLAFGTAISDARAELSPGLNPDLSLTHDGQTRLYDVFVPFGFDGSVPGPLVVDMHGFAADRSFQRSNSGFLGIAVTEGFLVAWPQGLFSDGDPMANTGGPGWNAGGWCCGDAGAANTDDVGFIRAMVEAIRAEANIDALRIYATGHSNGGALTHRLACEAPDLFAAGVSFSFPGPLVPCAPGRPMPMLMVHSRTDSVVPYDGGPLFGLTSLPIVPSAAEEFEAWRTRDGCTGSDPDVTETPGTTSECEFYTTCQDGVEVGLCSVDADPATLSGHAPYSPWIADGFNSEERAWEFLSSFVAVPEPAHALLLVTGALVLLGVRRVRAAAWS